MSNRFNFMAWIPSWQEMNYSHAPGDVDWFFNGEHFILSVFYDDGFAGQMQELEGVVIMQSTGLKDKNGVDIFEDDIIKRTSMAVGSHDTVGIVKKLEGCWVIDLGNDAIKLWTESDQNEVVGNIHENPELLENKQ